MLLSGELVPTSPKRRYATAEDWHAHRHTITSFYTQMRLKDVIRRMEMDHGFYATERMYKFRFKNWGLAKNVTAAELRGVADRLGKVAAADEPPKEEVTPEKPATKQMTIGLAKIRRYIRRNPTILQNLQRDSDLPLEVLRQLAAERKPRRSSCAPPAAATQKTICDTPSPSPVLRPPEPVELPYEIIRLLSTFIDGFYGCVPSTKTLAPFHTPSTTAPQPSCLPLPKPKFTTNISTTAKRDEPMLDFALKFRLAHNLIDEGSLREGFQSLNVCFDHLHAFLQDGGAGCRPVLLLYMLSSALEVRTDFGRPEVVDMLFRHVRELAESVLGTGHPISEIARRLCRLGMAEQVDMLRLMWRVVNFGAQAGVIAEREPAFWVYSQAVEMVAAAAATMKQVRMAGKGGAVVEEEEDRIAALLTLLEDEASIVKRDPMLKLWVDMRVAVAMYDLGRDEEAESYLRERWPAAVAIRRKSPHRMTFVIRTYKLRAGLRVQERDWAGAESLFAEACGIAQATWGEGDEILRGLRAEYSWVAQEGKRMKRVQAAMMMCQGNA